MKTSPVCCGVGRDVEASPIESVDQFRRGRRRLLGEMSDDEALAARRGQPRKLGDFAGRIRMSEDFDDWPPDLQEALGVVDPR